MQVLDVNTTKNDFGYNRKTNLATFEHLAGYIVAGYEGYYLAYLTSGVVQLLPKTEGDPMFLIHLIKNQVYVFAKGLSEIDVIFCNVSGKEVCDIGWAKTMYDAVSYLTVDLFHRCLAYAFGLVIDN